MHSLLRIVQSSMQPQQKDWSKYVHIHQQSACLTNLLSLHTCTQLNLTIVKWGKKQIIPTNLSFYEIHQCLNIKISFQAVKIYFLTFSSGFVTSYLQPIRNKLLKISSIFYPAKWGKYRPQVGYYPTAVRFLHHCIKFPMGKTQTL